MYTIILIPIVLIIICYFVKNRYVQQTPVFVFEILDISYILSIIQYLESDICCMDKSFTFIQRMYVYMHNNNNVLYRRHTSYIKQKNMQFVDKKTCIEGCVVWKKKDVKINLEPLLFPKIIITKCTNKNITNIDTFINEIIGTCIKNTQIYKLYTSKKIDLCIFSTVSKLMDERKATFMDSYFSDNKDIILRKFADCPIDKKQQYMFYGPSGTGKSSFVNRFRITNKMHVLDIDLSKNKVEQIYHIINSNYNSDMIYLFRNLEQILQKVEQIYYESFFGKRVGVKKNLLNCDEFMEILSNATYSNKSIVVILVEDYDLLQKKCPKICASSNIEKIKFDFMDVNNLQKLCMHHFGKKIDINNNIKLNIPMSCIMDKLLNSKICCANNEDSLKMFQDDIKILSTINYL